MTLRWIEGFEGATSPITTHHARIYATATGAATAVDGASVTADEAISSDDLLLVTKPIVSPVANSWVIGIAFRPNDLAEIEDGAAAYVAIGIVGGEQMRFEFVDAASSTTKPGGLYYAIRVMRGVTELATSDQKFLLSSDNENWIYFEFKVTINNTTGSFAGQFTHIRKPSLDGGTPTALTWDAASSSVDTQEQAGGGGDRFTLSLNTGDTGDPVAVDDIYVLDSAGSKNNDFLGKTIVQGQKPLNTGGGDGDTTDWALTGGAISTFDAWFESLTATEDDERLTSDVTTEIHLCVVEPLTVLTNPASTIVGVRLDTIQHMETSGDLDIVQMWRKTTGTPAQTNSGLINVASTTYEGLSTVLEDDPNTATAWAQADLTSYQYGVRNDG